MYRHFMVPVDGSILSRANTDAAIQLARQLGARITFFHAAPDGQATRVGQLLRSIAPESFTDSVLDDGPAVLSRCSAAAAAAGVPCDSLSKVCDQVAEAIVEAAQAAGCDLIVMASRGLRGMAGWRNGSQTERVLRKAPVALLVTRVASNDPIKAVDRALAVIKDEHRSISSVALGLREQAQAARSSGAAPDLIGLEAALDDLQAFSLRVHHPKEEKFLHPALRHRAPECEALLHEIEIEHLREQALLNETRAHLRAVMSEEGAASDGLIESALTLADAILQHVGLEERSVLPMARQHLHEEDWAEIASAFELNFGLDPDEQPVHGDGR